MRADHWMPYHTPFLWGRPPDALSFSLDVGEDHWMPYHTPFLRGQTTVLPIILRNPCCGVTECPIILHCYGGRPPDSYHTPLLWGKINRGPIILPCCGSMIGQTNGHLSYSLPVGEDQWMPYHTPLLCRQTTRHLSYSLAVGEDH